MADNDTNVDRGDSDLAYTLAKAPAWHIVHTAFLCGYLVVLSTAWCMFAVRRRLHPLAQRNPNLVLACNAFAILNLVCSLILRVSPSLQPCWLNNIIWSLADVVVFSVTAYRVFDLVFHYNQQLLQFHEGRQQLGNAGTDVASISRRGGNNNSSQKENENSSGRHIPFTPSYQYESLILQKTKQKHICKLLSFFFFFFS